MPPIHPDLTAHTPGPWVIIPARPYDGDDEALVGSFEAFAGIEGSDGSPVCVFGDAAGSATMFENEADYHLIAAAPELRSELQDLVDWLVANQRSIEGEFLMDDLLAGPRAALAKATVAV